MLEKSKSDRSTSEDGPDELLVVKVILLLHLELLEEFIEFVLGQFFTQVGHNVLELFYSDRRSLWLENRLHGLD